MMRGCVNTCPTAHSNNYPLTDIMQWLQSNHEQHIVYEAFSYCFLYNQHNHRSPSVKLNPAHRHNLISVNQFSHQLRKSRILTSTKRALRTENWRGMVCESCQNRQSRPIVPDKWKASTSSSSSSAVGAIRAGKTNRLLAARKDASPWIPDQSRCRLCKSRVQPLMHYCNDCAHKKGICAMCGKKTVDISSYKMSLT